MTKAQFKEEVVADLVYQWELKKTGWTSEHWYFSQTLYDLGRSIKEKAIEELINERLRYPDVIERLISMGRVYRFGVAYFVKMPGVEFVERRTRLEAKVGAKRQSAGVWAQNMGLCYVPAHPNPNGKTHGESRYLRHREQNEPMNGRVKISVYAPVWFRDDLNLLASENSVHGQPVIV